MRYIVHRIKIYEYAACGLPMIGSDVPGLTYPFSTNDIGYICKDKKVEEIINIVRTIECRYDEMVSNCLSFIAKQIWILLWRKY